MASQLLSVVKFGVLAAIAFTGPKLITDSGKYLARVEKRLDTGAETDDALIHPAASSFEPKARKSDSEPSLFTSVLSARPAQSETYGAESYGVGYPSDSSVGDSNGGLSGDAAAWRPRSTSPESESPSGPIQFTPLEQIVRFDLYPGTIASMWPKVYADDSVPDWRGYRVSVVTGTQKDDLTGALCYWFDRSSLRRITFGGQTGDIRKLLTFFEYRYGMTLQKDSPPDEYRYVASLERSAKDPTKISRLTIRPGQALDAAAPESNFRVDFDLYRP